MDWSTIAMTRLDELTATRFSGRPVNTHVIPSRVSDAPDFERMKTLVHNSDQKAPRTADAPGQGT